MQKLNGMTKRIVTVTQHTSRSGPGSSVAIEQGVSVQRIIELMTELPQKFGPGTYHFEVGDEGGFEKDIWTVRLGGGPDISVGDPQMTNGGTVPTDAGKLIQVGHGYFYNPELGILTTPSRQAYRWQPGQPLPGEASAPAATAVSASPWSALPPWGTLPVSSSSEVDVLREQLREARESRRDDELRRAIDETNRRLERALEAMSHKPQVSPAEETLRREIEQLRSEQAAGRREDTLRTEMQALVRSVSENKHDPMITMLTNMMAGQQQTSAEAVRSSKDAATLVVDRLANSTLTPDRLMSMLDSLQRQNQNAGGEVTRGMLDMVQRLFDMMGNVVKMQGEMQQGGTPWWADSIREGIASVSRVGQAIAQAGGAGGGRAIAPPPQVRVAPRLAPAPVVAPAPAPVVVPVAAPVPVTVVSTAEESSDDQRERAAAHVFRGADRTGGSPKRGRPPRAAAAAPAAPAAPAPPAPPAAAPAAAQAPAPAHSIPPPANGRNYTPEEMNRFPLEIMRALAGQFPDEAFFGIALDRVVELRAAVASGMTTADAAEAVLEAIPYLQAANQYPPVLEILDAGHVVVVIERLLPAATPHFRSEVAAAIKHEMETDGGAEQQQQA